MRREVLEETGLDVEVGELIDAWMHQVLVDRSVLVLTFAWPQNDDDPTAWWTLPPGYLKARHVTGRRLGEPVWLRSWGVLILQFSVRVAQRPPRRCCDVEMEPRAVTNVEEERQLDSAWRTFGPAALRFATGLVGPFDAQDIATAAFLRATRQQDWTAIEHFDRYLFRAVRNEAQNLYRQKRRRWERDLAGVRPDVVDDRAPDVDLWRAVASLSVQQRSVVFLAYWQDMTEADIADTLGVARSTVHRTLVRARIILRKALK